VTGKKSPFPKSKEEEMTRVNVIVRLEEENHEPPHLAPGRACLILNSLVEETSIGPEGKKNSEGTSKLKEIVQ